MLLYHDAPTVERVLSALDRTLAKGCEAYEIIAIDDHSSDETWSEIQRVAKESTHVVPLRNPTNLGVGASFQRAVKQARFPWVGYTDGDDQYEMSDLDAFWAHLPDADVVTGYRANRADGRIRYGVSLHFNWLSNHFFNLSLRDTNAALKVYSSTLIKSLPEWDSRAFYDTEILVRASHDHGANIVQVPIKHRDRAHGSAAGLSKDNITSVIGGMIGPRMNRYRNPSLATKLLILYCRSMRAACVLLLR